jgi:hypothetical protein
LTPSLKGSSESTSSNSTFPLNVIIWKIYCSLEAITEKPCMNSSKRFLHSITHFHHISLCLSVLLSSADACCRYRLSCKE